MNSRNTAAADGEEGNGGDEVRQLRLLIRPQPQHIEAAYRRNFGCAFAFAGAVSFVGLAQSEQQHDKHQQRAVGQHVCVDSGSLCPQADVLQY